LAEELLEDADGLSFGRQELLPKLPGKAPRETLRMTNMLERSFEEVK